MTVINVKWMREKKAFVFKDRILADIKLGELRQMCHEWTKVPLGGVTLIYGGATMKDNSAPLSCFGIKPNGQITMMGTRPSKTDIHTLTTNGDPEEYALILKIQQSLQKILDLAAEHVPRYEKAVEVYVQSNPGPVNLNGTLPRARKDLQDAYILLSENFLQSLLVFDGVVCKQDFEVARATRKEAVKEAQRLLDIIDEMNARVKACDRAPAGHQGP